MTGAYPVAHRGLTPLSGFDTSRRLSVHYRVFSTVLHAATVKADELDRVSPTGASAFAGLLEKASQATLSADEIVALVQGTRDAHNCDVLLDFASSLSRPHDREVLLLPPLYFSSICENRCAYCNFSHKGQRLSVSEFERELQFLLETGFRSIELVSGQDPALYGHAPGFSLTGQAFDLSCVLPYFEVVAQRLREAGGGMLTTNVPPLDVPSMRQLKALGLDCFLVWQETFNPGQYEALHFAHGPKSNQAFRIDAMENARDAGIEHLAGAFLKGLYDWRKEEVVLYLFEAHLKAKYGRGFSIIGSPRVKGSFADSRLVRSYQVSDYDYEVNIALDRVIFDGILWLQTRESFETNLRLMERFGAGVILTIMSSTAPGGYAEPASSHAQFPVFKQDLDESVERLRRAGLEPVFDWDASDLTGFQRTTAG